MEVYARAASVELLLNGRSLGKKTPKKDCRVIFKLPYENGVLEAVSYDAAGSVIGRDKLETAGEKTELRLEAEENRVQPGHLAFLRLRYTDEKGATKPCQRGMVTATVEGGSLEAFGSACPFYEQSYLDAESDTYYGEALLIVRAGESGKVRASVSDGRYSAQTELIIG